MSGRTGVHAKAERAQEEHHREVIAKAKEQVNTVRQKLKDGKGKGVAQQRTSRFTLGSLFSSFRPFPVRERGTSATQDDDLPSLESAPPTDSRESDVKSVDTKGSMMDLFRWSRASAAKGDLGCASSEDSVGRGEHGLHPTIEEDEEETHQTESDEEEGRDSDWSQSQASVNNASAVSLGGMHEANLSTFEIGNPLGDE